MRRNPILDRASDVLLQSIEDVGMAVFAVLIAFVVARFTIAWLLGFVS